MAATVAARSCRYRWTRAAAAVRWQCCCRRSAEADAAENRAGRRRSATYARAVEGGSKAFTKHTPPKMQRALRIGDVMKRNRWLQEEKKKREKKRLVSSTKQGVFFFFKVCEYRKKKRGKKKKHRIREKQEFMDCMEKRPLIPA